MTRRKRSLTDLCGGRFGVVPAAVCEAPDLPNGAFRLYAIICSRAKPDGTCHLCLKYIARKLGVSARTMQKWKRDLELLGWVQQLRHGDKAIGEFRVIRDPADRNPVRVSNGIKVGIRSATKSPHANKSAHTQCERDGTHNKNENRTPLNPPARSTAQASGLPQGSYQAWQGAPAASGAGSILPAPRRLNQKAPAREPDWNSWARWLTANRRLGEKEA